MRVAWRRSASANEWLVVGFCVVVVVLAGARLIVLSLNKAAAQASIASQTLANRDAAALQSQLQSLATLAQSRAAAMAAETNPHLGSNEFWLGEDGRLLGNPSDHQTAIDIAAAWGNSTSGSTDTVLGPIREGNRWLVAVRAPLKLPRSDRSFVSIGWSVIYQDLNELLVGAQLQRLQSAGYDFQLSRNDAAGRPVIVTGSAAAPLAEPVTSPIALPGDASSRAGWSLAVRPRAGWFPASALAVDVSLLTLVTWLVALGVRDTTRHLRQLRSALTVSRRRLHEAHQRLTHEIEQREQLQQSFDYAHFHDAFTGLPNRQFFLGTLDRALRDLRSRPERSLAILLIAITRFKIVTDTLGHTAGDELMLQITRHFGQALASQEHALARWSEDQLALMLPDIADASAASEAARALQLALQSPIALRRHRVLVGVSIGATFTESGQRRTEELMREADIALSTARTRGEGAGFAAYSASMLSRQLERVSVEADLQQALERNELRLLFQPIVDLRAHRIVGVEALLRWLHPVHGLLTPEHFLALAEEDGLIVPITHWIIQRACELSRQWRARMSSGDSFYISINLSPLALLDPELGSHVARALKVTGTSAATLKFELTENSLISNAAAARSALDTLHSMGIELMLDDFGTGYSSLSHLQLFPFDYLKIDGPFDGRPESSNGRSALVPAIAQIAATLGLKIIAEAVETTDAADTLEQSGCAYAQGKVFCGPVDAEQAIQRLCAQILEPLDEFDQQALRDELDNSSTLILPALPETAVS
jgi:diguanylate cyclase (GGDEF)-like protein